MTRLRDHGFTCHGGDKKRGRLYVGPNGVTLTSLKSAMKTIALNIIDGGDQKTLKERVSE